MKAQAIHFAIHFFILNFSVESYGARMSCLEALNHELRSAHLIDHNLRPEPNIDKKVLDISLERSKFQARQNFLIQSSHEELLRLRVELRNSSRISFLVKSYETSFLAHQNLGLQIQEIVSEEIIQKVSNRTARAARLKDILDRRAILESDLDSVGTKLSADGFHIEVIAAPGSSQVLTLVEDHFETGFSSRKNSKRLSDAEKAENIRKTYLVRSFYDFDFPKMREQMDAIFNRTDGTEEAKPATMVSMRSISTKPGSPLRAEVMIYYSNTQQVLGVSTGRVGTRSQWQRSDDDKTYFIAPTEGTAFACDAAGQITHIQAQVHVADASQLSADKKILVRTAPLSFSFRQSTFSLALCEEGIANNRFGSRMDSVCKAVLSFYQK